MAQETDNTSTQSTAWSSVLIDTLYVALQKKAKDKAIKEIIRDLKRKGYEDAYLVRQTGEKLGSDAANRVQTLLQGGSGAAPKEAEQAPRSGSVGAKAAAARRRAPRPGRRSGGSGGADADSFLGWIKGLFGK